jgi:hypothetical protein
MCQAPRNLAADFMSDDLRLADCTSTWPFVRNTWNSTRGRPVSANDPPFPDVRSVAAILEEAALRRYSSVRAFQRATGVQHTLFAAMRRGIFPGVRTLNAYCRGVGVTFASALAYCFDLDLNRLPMLHLLSEPTATVVLPTRAARTGRGVPFVSSVVAGVDANEIQWLRDLFKRFSDHTPWAIESLSEFRYQVARLGDWSLFPLFQPGDFLLVEPVRHGLDVIATLTRIPRPIVMVNRRHRQSFGRLSRDDASGHFRLESHPESGYPLIELTAGDWELAGIVRGYGAAIGQRAFRPAPWAAPVDARGHPRVVAVSRFASLARAARMRRGLSVEGVAEAIRQLTPHLPGPADLYMLSKSRVDSVETKSTDSNLNVFGLFGLLAIYGIDYREALDALGCPPDDDKAVPIQELLGVLAPPEALQIRMHPWFQEVLKTWRAIPWQFFALHPEWNQEHILYHGPQLRHPMTQRHSFLRVEKCEDLPEQPSAGVQQGLRWPLFVFETSDGKVCSNAYRAGRRVHIVQHPLLAPVTKTYELGRDIDIVGRVTGIASILPQHFDLGWK